MVFEKISDFINREHTRILIAIVILLIALVLFIEYSTFNGEALSSFFIDFLRKAFS